MHVVFDWTVGDHLIIHHMFKMKYKVDNDLIVIEDFVMAYGYRNYGYGSDLIKRFIGESPCDISVEVFDERIMTFYLRLGFEIESAKTSGEDWITQATLVYSK